MRAWFVPLVLIGALVLAGCDGSGSDGHASASGPRPTATATTPAPTDPSTTLARSGPPAPVTPTVPADVPTTGPNLLKPGEKPPVMPLEATQHTPAGAVAFAKFFIQTIDWGYATTSSAYMRHYSSPTCVTCRSVQSALDDAARKHRHFQGDRLFITRVSEPREDTSHGAELTLDVTYDANTSAVYDSAGRYIDGEPPLTIKDQLWLSWTGDHWVIAEFGPVR